MSSFKHSLFLFVFLIMIFLFSTTAIVKGVTQDAAASALNNAEETLNSAYEATLKAEGAGANVSSLRVELDKAGNLLAQGNMAYRSGNFDTAISLANLSRDNGKQIERDALKMGDSAVNETLQRQMLTMVESVIGVALIAMASFWSWHIFKIRYNHKSEVGASFR